MKPLDTPADLVSRVYDSLMEAICKGEIRGDEKVTQEAVAHSLNVSRQPVLQAFKLLEKDGILRATANKKGMEIVALDAHFVSHLYSVRATLDALAAKTAAAIPRPDLRDAGITILKRGKSAAQNGDLIDLVEADLSFHQFIYQSSGNPVLIQTSQLHWHQTRRVMSTYLRKPGSCRAVWSEHQAIFDAIVSGDHREAERRSRHHALNSIEFLFSQHRDD